MSTMRNWYLDIARRYALFIIGLFVASMGVALSTKAGLGTSPVASLPYTVSLLCGALSFGGWLNVLSVVQITTQVILQKGKCRYVEIFLQTVLAFVYGYLTDFSCYLIRNLSVTNYAVQLLYMALSCVVLAFGIWIQLKGNVAMLPGEAMNRAISQVTGKRYENIKIFFDVFYIAASAVLCLVFLGGLKGVREGSIIAALAVGSIIKLIEKIYRVCLQKKHPKKKHPRKKHPDEKGTNHDGRPRFDTGRTSGVSGGGVQGGLGRIPGSENAAGCGGQEDHPPLAHEHPHAPENLSGGAPGPG